MFVFTIYSYSTAINKSWPILFADNSRNIYYSGWQHNLRNRCSTFQIPVIIAMGVIHSHHPVHLTDLQRWQPYLRIESPHVVEVALLVLTAE